MKRRYLVLVDGKEAWLTERSFMAALTLAAAAHASDFGWVAPDQLAGHSNYHQVIRRLKRDLDVDGVETDDLIENNGAKRYRFSVPPQNLTIDAAAVEQHFPEGAALLRAAGLISDE